MAEKLAGLRQKGGGGSITEVALWTNSAPTATFSGQAVTLSDNISNYDYIAIETRFSTQSDNRLTYYFKAIDLPNCVAGPQPLPYLGAYNSNYYYYRHVSYSSDTSLLISGCLRNTASSAASINNGNIIPVSIKGIKYA